jgi:peptidoglycan/LPS O-acetylase OafA/YrhL
MKRLDLLDVARFAAALSVVCFHYLFNGVVNGKIATLSSVSAWSGVARYGYLGVEFFLMISGYVIFFSSKKKSAGDFAAARALRLFPAFWTAVLLTSCLAYFWGGTAMGVGLAQFFANLTMVSPLLGYEYVDGVYWTLALELSFYLLVLLFLLLGAESYLAPCLLAWPLLIFVCATVLKLNLPLLAGYYSYFAAGCVLAILKERRYGRVAWLALALSLANCLMFSARRGLRVIGDYHFSAWIVALAVLGFFVFFLLLNTRAGERVEIPSARLLGGLTYPLYLVHAHIGYMLMSHFSSDANRWYSVPLIFAVVLLVALAIHLLVEKSLHGYWRALFRRTVGHFVGWIQTKIPLRSALTDTPP